MQDQSKKLTILENSVDTMQQCCSTAKDLKVEAKDFEIFSRPRTHKTRPRTCKSRPRTWIKDNGHFSDFSMKSQNVGHLVMK